LSERSTLVRNIPYNDRTDLQKIQTQWNKIWGLLAREDWSAGVVRCATAAEIAVNLVIRKNFADKSTFASAFVDDMLKGANGIDGKFRRLLVPMATAEDKKSGKAMEKLGKLAKTINEQRNAIIHSGAFSNEQEASAIVAVARELIEALVTPHETGFKLIDGKPSSKAA
jgi:hypothetical protein